MILENVEVQWARLGSNAGTKYRSQEKEWSINVLLDDDKADKWKKLGTSPKLKEENGVKFVKLTKDCVWKKSGDPKKPPMVVDQFGEEVDPTIIGNGSKCNVQFSVRDWEYQGDKGKSAELVAVQVMDLVEYHGGGGDTLDFTFADKEGVPMSDEDVPF